MKGPARLVSPSRRSGAPVVLCAERRSGPSDHIGLHQTGRYRTRVAMDREVARQRVNRRSDTIHSHFVQTKAVCGTEWRELAIEGTDAPLDEVAHR